MLDLTTKNLIRLPGFANVDAFSAGEDENMIRLHLNEGLPPSPKIRKTMLELTKELQEERYPMHLYPYLIPPGLRKAYSQFLQVGRGKY